MKLVKVNSDNGFNELSNYLEGININTSSRDKHVTKAIDEPSY